jgi:MoxR-like ATPase
MLSNVNAQSGEWRTYKGDGRTPDGRPPDSRGESGRYLADDELVNAVNAALAVEQPLLVTGEPGTGKTLLAWSVASELGLGPVLEFHTRSDHQARDALFVVDNLMRFYHAQTNDARATNPTNYIRWQALGEAIRSEARRLVLIDEIDKAPRDFPNDLLDELDRMEFRLPETGEIFRAKHRPVVIITSNSERQLPDPFLRRCAFHRIEFPDEKRLLAILRERLAPLGLAERLCQAAVKRFEEVRALANLEKKPATGELIAWVRVLHRAGIDATDLENWPLRDLPYPGLILKNERDTSVLRPRVAN